MKGVKLAVLICDVETPDGPCRVEWHRTQTSAAFEAYAGTRLTREIADGPQTHAATKAGDAVEALLIPAARMLGVL